MLRFLDLPNEVLDMTISNLRQPELYNLCLVSRRTYESARPYLYRDVTIIDRKDFGGTGTLNGLRSFTRTIWKNPKLADQVVSLRMLDAPVRSSPRLRTEADWRELKAYHPFPRENNKDEKIMCEDLAEMVDNELAQDIPFIGVSAENANFMRNHMRANSRCGLMGLILNKLNSRVQTLHVDIEKSLACTKMDPPVNFLTGGRAEYVSVRTAVVRGHASFSRVGVPILHADGWAWMPQMESFSVDNCIVKELNLTRGDTFCQLENLTITNCTLEFHLSSLLTPKLRTLAIENCRYGNYNLHNVRPFVQNWPCTASLESLTVLDSDCVASGSFADFSRLKYLAVDIAPWLQHTLNAAGTRPSIESLLPPSLVGLHLGDCFLGEFPPTPATTRRVESQMFELLRSRNDGNHPDLEFVEVSVYGRHDGTGRAPPKRQLKMREKIQKAFRDAVPMLNSHGQMVQIFFTMLCSCVWDCKHLEQTTGVSAQQTLSSCWLAQEPSFKRAGVAVPAA